MGKDVSAASGCKSSNSLLPSEHLVFGLRIVLAIFETERGVPDFRFKAGYPPSHAKGKILSSNWSRFDAMSVMVMLSNTSMNDCVAA